MDGIYGESGRGGGRVGLWWGGGEGKGREEEEAREGEDDGMERDEDGMVYVYMIVQMSTNIRDSQTRRVKVFFGKKSHYVIRRKRDLLQDVFQLIS